MPPAIDLLTAAGEVKQTITTSWLTNAPLANTRTRVQSFCLDALAVVRAETPVRDWLTVIAAKNAFLPDYQIPRIRPGYAICDELGTMMYQMLFLAYNLPTTVLSTTEKTNLLAAYNTYFTT